MHSDYVLDLLSKNLRLDERSLDSYRKPIKVEVNISKHADGSAKATIGDTEVIVGVKLGVGEPYPDTLDEGSIIVSAELLPLSSPDFEAGPPDEWAIELARVVDRGIRESKALNFKKLCIRKGELCWIVFIDIYTINNAGNLFDAAALAAVAALQNARFPKLEDDKVKYGELTKEKLPLEHIPITCTLLKIKDKILVDPRTEEELVMDSRLSVAIVKDKIHAMQKGGDKGLTVDDITTMIDIAFDKSKELHKAL